MNIHYDSDIRIKLVFRNIVVFTLLISVASGLLGAAIQPDCPHPVLFMALYGSGLGLIAALEKSSAIIVPHPRSESIAVALTIPAVVIWSVAFLAWTNNDWQMFTHGPSARLILLSVVFGIIVYCASFYADD